jgi:hypothetical protein
MLVLIIAGLLFNRKEMVKAMEEKDKKIDAIIDEFHSGNLTMADAMKSLTMVLYEIKGRL